jgi:hypothetical protein
MGLRQRHHGVVTEFELGSDRRRESPTLQCGHCGGHWVPEPGSGRVRGWCLNCCRPVCGPGCEKCVPLEQMLENIEKGRPWDFKPVVSTGG